MGVAPSPADFQESVARLIGLYLPSGRCSIKTIAQRLGIHRSTLNKRLIRTNQSYLRLLQAARIERATQLCRTNQPLRDIARELGFADLSVFSRWFTATYGRSASAWRKAQTPPAPVRRASEPGLRIVLRTDLVRESDADAWRQSQA